MQLLAISKMLILSSTLLSLSAYAAPTDDWKTLVGWDGVVLPATDIGTPYVNVSTRSAENIGGVYICTDINWGGRCGYAVQPLNTCIVLGSDWNKLISSFGPDQCTSCFIYSNNACALSGIESWVISYPGDATGGTGDHTIGGPWNDLISSFKCFQTTC